MDVEKALAALEGDRIHGAGYLARKALGLLAATSAADRERLAERLSTLRPAMPAIAAAVAEALATGDAKAVIHRADDERRRLAELAAEMLRDRQVATISNSSLVARTLLKARPPLIQVVLLDEEDEGQLLLTELRANQLTAVATSLTHVEADVAVVGCDAVFDDRAFVNRRGTAALAKRLYPRPVLVLTEGWKRVQGPSPRQWPEPDLFEIVAPAANVDLLAVSR